MGSVVFSEDDWINFRAQVVIADFAPSNQGSPEGPAGYELVACPTPPEGRLRIQSTR